MRPTPSSALPSRSRKLTSPSCSLRRPISDCYIIFGEGKPEDPSANPFAQINQMAQQEQFQQQQAQLQQQAGAEGSVAEGKAPATDAADEGDVDESGLEEDDINVVMSQANCDRAKGASSPPAFSFSPSSHLD